MASLLDIAPETATIKIQGKDVSVYGVSARGIAYLAAKYPEVKKVLAGKEFKGVSPERLVDLVPDAIASIIAAGCGMPGDKKAEAIADKLPTGDQVNLLTEIIRLTMPDGFGPFVERLRAVGSLVPQPGVVPDSQSRTPSNT